MKDYFRESFEHMKRAAEEMQVANRGLQEHSDLPAFVSPPMTLAEMVRAAVEATHGIS